MSNHPIIDDDRLLKAILVLMSECDPARRIEPIRELDSAERGLHEADTSAKGHAAISDAVTELLAGPPKGPVAVTGTDVARFERGLVRTLLVSPDPTNK